MATKILTATRYQGPPDYLLLEVIRLDEEGTEVDEPYIYVLYQDDPYGDAPALREQLQKMVDAGEIEIVNGNPEGWPWWVEPPPPEEQEGEV